MTTRLKSLSDWVAEVAELTSPDRIHWCDGTEQEYRKLVDEMLDNGTLLELNQDNYPGCYLHRSRPDRRRPRRAPHLRLHARTRPTPARTTTGRSPPKPRSTWKSCFRGSMRGRTMYVIPYCMGPIDSPYARCGVEITDSPYVVANMYLMTRIGKPALKRIENDKTFVKGLALRSASSIPTRRYIMHFPEELTIMSYGSGYGGNALLGKKCHALRIASYQARTEGWLAEHMLIVGVQSPEGDTHYLACAFPSACGKTNLAMLIPPASQKGWKVWTLGDDIAWMHLDAEGQLRAINPEAGYFGVVPGTNPQTNRNAYDMIGKDTIFTNVAVTADNDPWWEEKGSGKPTIDWVGRAYDSRATAPPLIRTHASPCRRSRIRATRSSPKRPKACRFPRSCSAAAAASSRRWSIRRRTGRTACSSARASRPRPRRRPRARSGVVRRDPMAMKPFCGYNYGDYWAHWLSFGKRSSKLPKIFHVNWFRRDANGKFLWPGFGENLRVLRWIIDRCEGRVGAVETPIGFLPKPGDIDMQGLDVLAATRSQQLLAVDPEQWRTEMESIGEYFAGVRRSVAERAARGASARSSGAARLRERGASALRPAASLFDDEVDRERGPGLRDSAETDHAFADQLRAVAPHEDLFAGVGLHERAVGALVHERELVAARFDPRVHARDQDCP